MSGHVIPEWEVVDLAHAAARLPIKVPVVAADENACRALSPRVAWICTRHVGHSGRHAAALTGGEVLAVWA